LDDALEKAARAVCVNLNLDPDEFKEWGPYVGGSAWRANPNKERWRCVVDAMGLRDLFIGLDAIGVTNFDKQNDDTK
jgi:hypothetical protein